MKICNKCVWLRNQKKIHSCFCFNSDSKFYKISFPHSKTKKACSLYEPRNPDVILQNVPEGMKLVEDLRGREEFQDSDFWIIGTDSNLDFYPDDFFDHKYSIAVNISCIGFPESTFLYQGGRKGLEGMISKHPDCLKKVILPLVTLKPKFSAKARREMPKCCRSGFSKGLGLWENWGLEPIYVKFESQPMTKSVPDYELMVKRILSGGPCDFILTRTSIHIAIFVATILGAKKIILVGCSHKAEKGRIYAHKRGMGNYTSPAIEEALRNSIYGSRANGIERMRRDTMQLAKIFKKYDIEIIRHRYDEEKEKFVFEEINEA